MSIAALDWAWKQDCPNATSKLVLIALADKANDDGECWPGMEHVARMVGISTRQVSTHLQRLEEVGLLTRKRRRSGIGRLGSYVFHLKVASGSRPPVEADRHRKPASGSTPPLEGDDQWKPDVETTGSPASSPPEAGFRTEPTVNPQGTQRGARKRATQLPNDWEPNDKHRALARELGVDVDRERPQFEDHHAAKGSTFKDWDRAFNTWLRNAQKFGNVKTAPVGKGGRRAGVTFDV